ncbi:MAG: hypothetical protein IJL66_02340 [Lachnospiraceae bacterium]|nr:hypothetical protein [Lachnospiraceae bacterium]
MKRSKKWLSLALVFGMAFSMVVPVYAGGRNGNKASLEYVYIDNYKVQEASAEQEKQNEKYAEASVDNVWQFVLDRCQVAEDRSTKEMTTIIYTTTGVNEIFRESKEITGVFHMGDAMYVEYKSGDGKEITLVYTGKERVQLLVYDPKTDELYSDLYGKKELHKNFRHGTQIVLTDESLKLLDRASPEEWQRLAEESEKYDEIFFPEVENLLTARGSGSGEKGATNPAELLADLKSNFPMYTDQLKRSTWRYCAALSKNVAIRVSETRNGYIKVKADFRSFVINTTFTTIAAKLSISSLWVAPVLTVAGIAYSALGFITEAATLVHSAEYRFLGQRIGRVFDSTRFNAYVRTVTKSGYGKFSGGYDSSGIFRWIISGSCPAYEKTYEQLADIAMSNYNADIVSHGTCTYEP